MRDRAPEPIANIFLNRTGLDILKSILKGILTVDTAFLGFLGLMYSETIENEIMEYTDTDQLNSIMLPSIVLIMMALKMFDDSMPEDPERNDNLKCITALIVGVIIMCNPLRDERSVVEVFHEGVGIEIATLLSYIILIKYSEWVHIHDREYVFVMQLVPKEDTTPTFDNRMETIKQRIYALGKHELNKSLSMKLNKLSDSVDNFEKKYCGLSHGIPDDPVTLPETGHTYGRAELVEHFKHYNKCPTANTPLTVSLTRLPAINVLLKDTYAEKIKKYGQKIREYEGEWRLFKEKVEQEQNPSTQPESKQEQIDAVSAKQKCG